MKDISVQVEKVTGQASDSVACGVFTARIPLAGGNVGTLVSCILIKASPDADLSEAQRNIFEIAEKKLDGIEGGILAVLQSAVANTKTYGENLEISLLHTFFYEGICYVCRLGEGVKLFVFDPPKSVEIKFESGSGPVSGGQIYLLATEAFFSIFDTSVFAQEAEVDFEDIIDGIATEIAGEENQAEVGAAFISVKGEEIGEDASEKVGDEVVLEDKVVETETGTETEERDVVEEKPDQIEDSSGKKPGIRFSNPFAPLGKKLFSELNRIRKGDIGAIRRNLVLVAVLVVLVLGGSVGFTLYQKDQRVKSAQFDEHLAQASTKYSEGVAIIDLNKSRARDILIEADREVKLALDIKPGNEKGKKLSDDISQKLKETEVTSNVNFSEVVNLGDSIKSLGFAGRDLVGISGDKVYKVNLVSKDKSDVDSKGGVDSGFVFDNKAFVISGGKILRVDVSSGESADVGEGANGLDIAVFSGNVYVLFANSITKFVPIEGGYSQGSEYLNSPDNFTQKSRFAIDGSIWVSSGNKIFKYTRGAKENFEISGLVGGVGEFGLIYTNSSLDNLYIVDMTNSAVLVVNKEGVYKKVLQSPEFGRATDLAVDENEEKLYISTGSKILEASLK